MRFVLESVEFLGDESAIDMGDYHGDLWGTMKFEIVYLFLIDEDLYGVLVIGYVISV